MLLEFDADQRLWQDTVRDAVGKQCPPSLVREVAENGVDPSPLWQAYIDAGWTELTDPENAVELAIVLEELGRATDPTPFLATLTQFAPSPATASTRKRPVRRSTTASPPTATPTAGCWTERHDTSSTPTGRTVGGGTGRGLPRRCRRVAIRRSPVFDPVLHVADVSFAGVRLPDTERLHTDAEKARHLALTGMAITTVGACQRILDLVLEHVKQRQQFGVAIGSFQAVQHKAVDMHVATERARALSYFAALIISADDPRRRLASAMAKAAAGECQAVVFRDGLQLFGAMGFTWENDLQFALKRAKAGELLLGGAAEHRAMIAEEFNAADF
jgi:alkylation response protein AidB-like acyl-CoA dehydrogenase